MFELFVHMVDINPSIPPMSFTNNSNALFVPPTNPKVNVSCNPLGYNIPPPPGSTPQVSMIAMANLSPSPLNSILNTLLQNMG